MKKLATFIKENGITATTQRVMSRQDDPGDVYKPGDGARHWIVTLIRGDRTMPVEFSQGSAHTKPPTIEDVLGCLASDIDSVENSLSFENWAESIGYDPDSRKAERIYQAIKQQAKDLRHLLNVGKSGYPLNDRVEELLQKVERE